MQEAGLVEKFRDNAYPQANHAQTHAHKPQERIHITTVPLLGRRSLSILPFAMAPWEPSVQCRAGRQDMQLLRCSIFQFFFHNSTSLKPPYPGHDMLATSCCALWLAIWHSQAINRYVIHIPYPIVRASDWSTPTPSNVRFVPLAVVAILAVYPTTTRPPADLKWSDQTNQRRATSSSCSTTL